MKKSMIISDSRFPTPPSSVLAFAKGPVPIPLTNDYLFRACLQKNNRALKGLISALMHLPVDEIVSAEITNPIELGKSIDDKAFFLDVRILLNNKALINLEMQVANEYNWPERSLTYLCRSFDNLNAGKPYKNVMPAIQIGLLDFTLFPSHPEFYATYKFLNVKNHTLYSDKIQLSVLDLNHIHLATEEDKLHQIDYWASLFKAITWEEIKMIAANNEYIKTASETIYKLSQTEKIRLQCEAREDYHRRQRSIQLTMEETKAELKRQNLEIKKQNLEIEKQNFEIERQAAIIQQKDSAYSDLLEWARQHGYQQ